MKKIRRRVRNWKKRIGSVGVKVSKQAHVSPNPHKYHHWLTEQRKEQHLQEPIERLFRDREELLKYFVAF